MKTANQLINPAMQAIRTAQPVQPSSINEDAMAIVNGLFKSLQAAKPAWKNAFPDDESLRLAKKTYVKGLIESGVTDHRMITAGMKRARADASPWFPAVGQFIEWCKPRPEDLGMPDSNAAWLECCNNSHRKSAHNWSHPGAHEAGSRTGWFAMSRGEVKEAVFAKNYADVIREVSEGAVFEVPKMPSSDDQKQLENDPSGFKTKTQRAIAANKAAMAGFRGGL